MPAHDENESLDAAPARGPDDDRSDSGQISPLKGLMDPGDEGAHSPASDADAPAPPG